MPLRIKDKLLNIESLEKITEIRLRVNNFLLVYLGKKELVLNIKVAMVDIIDILKNVSSNSIYSIQKDLNKGYITIPGGHRIGIAGEVVVVDGEIKNIKDISSMNIRIAHEIIGSSNEIMDLIIKEGKIQNTLIVSPPCLGKTTLLRDVIRNLSNMKYNVAVIDERGEIACMYKGESMLNIGNRTDVISYVEKSTGMQMAVRSLAPDVVCTDEIGDIKDYKAIEYVCRCGVGFITTMHGDSLKDVENSEMKGILDNHYLDNVIVLGKEIGHIDKIYSNLRNKEVVKC